MLCGWENTGWRDIYTQDCVYEDNENVLKYTLWDGFMIVRNYASIIVKTCNLGKSILESCFLIILMFPKVIFGKLRKISSLSLVFYCQGSGYEVEWSEKH